MIILGISGSPRQGATEHILTEALNMLKEKGFETRMWTIRGKEVGYCAHCDYCLESKECFLQDDMQEFYVELTKAKGIIIASPVYNGGVSAQIKAIMDRSRAAVAADKTFLQRQNRHGHRTGRRQSRWPRTRTDADPHILHTKQHDTSQWRILRSQPRRNLLDKRHTRRSQTRRRRIQKPKKNSEKIR